MCAEITPGQLIKPSIVLLLIRNSQSTSKNAVEFDLCHFVREKEMMIEYSIRWRGKEAETQEKQKLRQKKTTTTLSGIRRRREEKRREGERERGEEQRETATSRAVAINFAFPVSVCVLLSRPFSFFSVVLVNCAYVLMSILYCTTQLDQIQLFDVDEQFTLSILSFVRSFSFNSRVQRSYYRAFAHTHILVNRHIEQ